MHFALRWLGAAMLLAAAATAAQAQSTVQLYGLVDVGVGEFEDNNNRPDGSYFTQDWARRWKAEPGMMSSSFWGLQGREELVNGVGLVFKLEAFFLGDSGAQGRFASDSFFGRNAWLGLSSKDIGTVSMGRSTTPLFLATQGFNPFGNSLAWSPSMRQYFNVGAGGQLRGDWSWNNSLRYQSAGYKGMSVSAMVAAGEGAPVAATTGTGKNWSVGGEYDGGPFALTGVWQSVEQANTGGNTQDTWQLGASWDFKFVKLFGQYGEVDDRDISGVRARIWAASASLPLGGGRILGSYGESSFSAGGSGKRTSAALGYNYPLSRRTDLSAVVMGEEVKAGRAIDFSSARPVAGSIATIDNDGVSYGINVRHRF